MSAVTILAYALYTVDAATVWRVGSNKLLLTLPPVVFGILRYQARVYRDAAGDDPAETLLKDGWLGASVLLWLVLVLLVLTNTV